MPKSAQKKFVDTFLSFSASSSAHKTHRKYEKHGNFCWKLLFVSHLCTSCIFLSFDFDSNSLHCFKRSFHRRRLFSCFTNSSCSSTAKNCSHKLAVLFRFNKPEISRIFQLDYINKRSRIKRVQQRDELEFWEIFTYKLFENCEKWFHSERRSPLGRESLPPSSEFISSTILVNVAPARIMKYGTQF